VIEDSGCVLRKRGSNCGGDSVGDGLGPTGKCGGGGAASVDRVADEVSSLRSGSLGCYIQLPMTLRPTGDAVVSRVRDFLDRGLLTRFRLAEAVLPALSPDGSVVLVAGHTPAEVRAPDDEAARVALLHVLAHALRADKAPAKLRVRVVTGQHGADEIARIALTPYLAPDRAADQPRVTMGSDAEMSYQDWRTEVLGMVSVEF
jgi:hypothetical protein